MNGCEKCNAITAVLILLAGIGFVMADLKVWSFWSLNWWSVIFLIVGITSLAMGTCKDCKAMRKSK